MKRRLFSILLAGFLGMYCAPANAGSYTDGTGTAAGTVTDNTTGLIWQKCSAGQSGASCATGTAGTYTWENAISYCEGLSLGDATDWRLPNVKELKSIADMTTLNPAINATYFPATVVSWWYWSSTTYAGGTWVAWGVGFYGGGAGGYYKTNAYYVRCVRGQ